MTNVNSPVEQDDLQGYMINLERQHTPPPDVPGGLFPYQFLHPTISNGYIFYPSGNTYPYR